MAVSDEQTAAGNPRNSVSVDSSLWFDSFSSLLTELENLPLSSSSDLAPPLAEKLKENRLWFLNTVAQFKPPSQNSKEALNSQQVIVGSHKLSIKPQFRDLAFKLSSTMCLDEIQSYIFVERTIDDNALFVDGVVQQFLNEIMLQYYTERQCLLKCVRQMVIHALSVQLAEEEKTIWHEVVKLFSDGLEGKLISILDRHLTSSYPENMDVDLFVLWAEEILIEDNLVLDLLFLAYYESFCTCRAAKWKELCFLYKGMTAGSSNFVKLGVSAEAIQYSYRAKIQMLLILIETLNFENLLQMIHDDISVRDGSSVFSPTDILEIDSVVSSFDVFDNQEAGLLMLAWAVFLCLVVSLPGKEEHDELMEIDHTGYVHQAFEAASLSLFLEILQSDILKDSDGPAAGYRSIFRTFISAFIASYEINVQLEDDTLRLILSILCEIYRGEESLCVQFWDKDSIVDGPIRCLLRNMEGEFPYRTTELTKFLSALSEGSWPAECVYNFMDKSMGISSLVEIGGDFAVGGTSQIVETQLPLHVPALEGVVIPSGTRGHVLRMIDSKTALVRWEYKQSGVIILLLHLAQVQELSGNEEVLAVLDLFSRLASFNKAVCFSLMNIGKSFHFQTDYSDMQMENNIWIDMVEVLCNLIRNLSPYCGSVLVMSMGVNILAKMMKWYVSLRAREEGSMYSRLRTNVGLTPTNFGRRFVSPGFNPLCSPSHVSMVVKKMNIFDLSSRTSIFRDHGNDLSSGSGLLSGRLAKMLLIDCEHNVGCPLTVSVLDFTGQLLEAGVENDFALALVIFGLQYVFVNHEYWRYKVKQDRWKVTLQVLGLFKTSITSVPFLAKIGGTMKDLILSDSSIHGMFFRITCTTSQALEKLYVSRLYDWKEIDGLQHAVCSMLDILVSILLIFSEEDVSSLPVFHQAVLSTSTKPVPLVVALASLMSYFRNPAIQAGATSALAVLCLTAGRYGHANFRLDSKQVAQLRHSVEIIIREQAERNEELFIAVIKLLTSAAIYQPAFLASIFSGEDIGTNLGNSNGKIGDSTVQALKSEKANNLVDTLVLYVEGSESHIERNAQAFLSMLYLMRALWQGAAQYIDILETIRKSKKFWKQLSESILVVSNKEAPKPTGLSEADAHKFACLYQCQSAALDIMALENFLQKKLLHAESLVKQPNESFNGRVADGVETNTHVSANLDILFSWSESFGLSKILKSTAACIWETDIYLHAKIAFGLLTAHMIGKLTTGDAGSLSVSFIEKITVLSEKLINLPAFSELCSQYSRRGYSEGTQIKTLILSDFYYHMQGELEGRHIENGPFKELAQFLMGSKLFQIYQKRSDCELLGVAKVGQLFDLKRLRHDIGLDIWDYSEWKASKMIGETMLVHLHDANSMELLVGSRLLAVRALTTILTLNGGDSQKRQSTSNAISRDEILSCVDYVCKEFHATVGVVVGPSDAPREVLSFMAAEAELLICLTRHVDSNIPSPTCLTVLKTCSSCLKGLRESGLLVSEAKLTIRSLLMLLLLVLESCPLSTSTSSQSGRESEPICEVSNICLGLLPVLCRCTEVPDQSIISLSTIDLIAKRFLTPSTWFPIIQRHLQLQQLISMLYNEGNSESLSIILKFFFTLASVRGGAEMLLASGFLSSLRVLFSDTSDGSVARLVKQEEKIVMLGKSEKPQFIWGLGLAVLTAIICSLGESSLRTDVVDNMISFFLSENADLISYHLSAPDIPSYDHDKKRARALKRDTSLSGLRETEHTLMLMSFLAKHRNSWVKATQETGSELRKRIIHLLAFISRTSHRIGESLTRPAPFLCVPIIKEEMDSSKQLSFMNIKSGWFGVTAHGCVQTSNVSDETLNNAVVVRGQADVNENSRNPTYFSDNVAVQIYRITLLALKNLCSEAADSARRAEELGFIDLSHFPELPDPDILHQLQDQSFSIVTEVCEANRSKQIQPEAQSICLMLLRILEMALYLEFCVSQICGIRPVMGRVEDFSRELRLLVRGTEGQGFLKSPMKHLMQIVSFMYPGLLQSEGIMG